MKKEVISKIESKLKKAFEINKEKIHKARRDFIIRFIVSLILCRSVQYSDLSQVFNDEVEKESNHRRIQDFIANYNLSYVQIALLTSCFLPKGKWDLSIDRTNWKFGGQSFNILAVTVYCKGVGVPIYFEMLDNKGGNSNQEQRIGLLGKIIKIFGKKQINCIIGDREFIGEKWCKWLIKNKVHFYIRIHNDHKVKLKNGKEHRAENLVYPKRKRFFENVEVFGCKVNVAMQKTNKKNKKGERENLVVVTSSGVRGALHAYKTRWSIEVFFQSIKKRGFKLESTHLKDPIRLKKLFALVCVAYAICLKTGIWKHENIKAIKIKKHGYKAKSFFRYGLDSWQDVFRCLYRKQKLLDDLLQIIIKSLEANLFRYKQNLDIILRKKSFLM